MNNAVLTIVADGDRVFIIVQGVEGDVTLALTPTDAREIAAKLLKEAHVVDLDASLDGLFAGEVGEA